MIFTILYNTENVIIHIRLIIIYIQENIYAAIIITIIIYKSEFIYIHIYYVSNKNDYIKKCRIK